MCQLQVSGDNFFGTHSSTAKAYNETIPTVLQGVPFSEYTDAPSSCSVG